MLCSFSWLRSYFLCVETGQKAKSACGVVFDGFIVPDFLCGEVYLYMEGGEIKRLL